MKAIKRFLLLVSIFLFNITAMEKYTPPIEEKATEQKLIYSKHAKEKMEERGISEDHVEDIIQTGQRFLDTEHPDSILYREKSKKGAKQLVIVTVPGKKSSEILIITLYNANTFGKKKKIKKKYH